MGPQAGSCARRIPRASAVRRLSFYRPVLGSNPTRAVLRIDHAEIERRTLAALERERYESTRADAEREEALAKKRADLARIEEEVRASVERRRVEDREFSAAMVSSIFIISMWAIRLTSCFVNSASELE